MSKLSLVNLTGSLLTIVLWAITLVTSAIAVSTRNRGLVMIGGLLTLFLWGVNFTGIVLGLVASLQDKKDWKAWLGLALHSAQWAFASLIFVLGVVVHQPKQAGFIE